MLYSNTQLSVLTKNPARQPDLKQYELRIRGNGELIEIVYFMHIEVFGNYSHFRQVDIA